LPASVEVTGIQAYRHTGIQASACQTRRHSESRAFRRISIVEFRNLPFFAREPSGSRAFFGFARTLKALIAACVAGRRPYLPRRAPGAVVAAPGEYR